MIYQTMFLRFFSSFLMPTLPETIFIISPCVLTDATAQGVRPDQIVFTDVAVKNEHIRRSALADLFLDT